MNLQGNQNISNDSVHFVLNGRLSMHVGILNSNGVIFIPLKKVEILHKIRFNSKNLTVELAIYSRILDQSQFRVMPVSLKLVYEIYTGNISAIYSIPFMLNAISLNWFSIESPFDWIYVRSSHCLHREAITALIQL